MNADLELIAHEVRELARMVSDKESIAAFINKCHGTAYHGSDIEKILLGIKPTASVPQAIRYPNAVRQTAIMAEPIAWTPPISTRRNGIDPLAKACLEYGVKYGGVMGASANDCKAMLEALAA
jgi:hypothetical protein